MLMMLPSVLGNPGVVQGYMEDNVVLAPIGETVCHTVTLADEINNPHDLRVTITSKPDFVDVTLPLDGVCRTNMCGECEEGLVFMINTPQDANVGDAWVVNFKVERVIKDVQGGMVPLEGVTSPKFDIMAVITGLDVYKEKCKATVNQCNIESPPIVVQDALIALGELEGGEPVVSQEGTSPEDSSPQASASVTIVNEDPMPYVYVSLIVIIVTGLFLLRLRQYRWEIHQKQAGTK